MNLDTLKGFDSVTANGVLAAAALTTSPNAGLGEVEVVKKYRSEADAVIREIREKLALGEGELRPDDRVRFDEFLARAIKDAVFSDRSQEDALARAGQSGRLPPSLYEVAQPARFVETFYKFGLKKKTIEDAINRPDDLQHLMNSEAKDQDTISLFMKRWVRTGTEPHWLLVQTLRVGITQIAQSAWRVYPSDVDLSKANSPLDVLKAFVEVFGGEVRLGSKVYKFLEDETFEGEAGKAVDVVFKGRVLSDFFYSVSRVQTNTPGRFKVGAAYCIDLTKYKAALRRRGFSV